VKGSSDRSGLESIAYSCGWKPNRFYYMPWYDCDSSATIPIRSENFEAEEGGLYYYEFFAFNYHNEGYFSVSVETPGTPGNDAEPWMNSRYET
jgi:hypothetical protein